MNRKIFKSTYLLRIMEISFNKKVSKGSRFNQIYIPKFMEGKIEVGDLVEVKLLKKQIQFNYKNKKVLSGFKKYLIKRIFSNLQKFKEITIIFIVGSFLYEDIYNDIDLIIVSETEKKNLERDIEELLRKKLNQRFHILVFSEKKLKTLIEKDPLTQAMLNSYVSNKKIDLDYKKTIDKNHINFLLMMPEDLLEITLSSRAFYDSLRRLAVIEQFLKDKELDRREILNQIKKCINPELLSKIKNNAEINGNEVETLRRIIIEKIKGIKKTMKNGQKK